MTKATKAAAFLFAATNLLTVHTVFAGGGNWNNSSGGVWQTGGNWSTNDAPTASDNANFNLGATYTISFSSNGVVKDLNLSTGTVAFDLTGQSISSANGLLNVGYAAGNDPQLTLIGGSVTFSGTGASGVGISSGATGRLTVDSATLTLQNSTEFDLGNIGDGSLSIINSGRVSSNSTIVAGYHGGNGWISVAGSNSRLISGAFIDVGDGAGANGMLWVHNGGQAASGSAAIIGTQGGNGWATVNGANSKLSSTGGIIDVGDGGNGTLLIQNSAQASSDSGRLFVGYSTNGKGYVSVTSGGSLSSSGAVIGAADGNGTVSISGNGSAWVNSANLYIGNDGSNDPLMNGSGTLNLLNAGSISLAGNLGLYSGQITVDASTLLQTAGSSANLAVGDRGSADFYVQNGAQVNTNSNLIIGYHSGTGRTTVTGTSSSLAVSGAAILDIGDGATGSLLIQNGGYASINSNGYVGFASGNGYVGVSGANSRLNIGGSLHVGNGAAGLLELSSNGAATVNGTLKVYSGGTLSLASGAALDVGTLDLSGNPSHFVWTGGTLRINSFAPNADGALTVPNTGTLGGNGEIDRATTVVAGATLAPGSSAGKLSFDQSLTLQSTGANHATFQVELGGDPAVLANAGSTFDQVVVSGSGRIFTIGGAILQVIPLPTIVYNKPYQVVKLTGSATADISTKFSNLSDGIHYADDSISYTVSYDPNGGIYVSVAVPEPTAGGLLIAASLLLKRRSRRN